MSIKYLDIDNSISYLKNNKIIAFPTETVYGLGGNAFNKDVINDIYKVKERPSQDPLIVHIDKIERIIEWELTDISDVEFEIVKNFSKEFSPGPFTMILKSSKKVPSNVTGNTNYIGIRIPNNHLALKLIEKSSLPIAAPSANKFGHISPTRKEHVYNEFKDQQILNYPIGIMDNGYIPEIGIESTIIKFDFKTNSIKILRPGFVTKYDLLNFIRNSKFNFKLVESIKYKKLDDNLESSGELIKHYAPNCNTILVKTCRKIEIEDLPIKNNFSIIDVNYLALSIKNISNYYKNLGKTDDLNNLTKFYYNELRLFERLNKNIQTNILYLVCDSTNKDLKYTCLLDRMVRSASGNIINILT